MKIYIYLYSIQYVDNVLYLSNPETTIYPLKELILEHGYLSGYNVNIDQTVEIRVQGN